MIKRIYRPTTDLDKRLLASIPQKILAWATLINAENVTPGIGGNFGVIHWHFDDEGGTHIFLDPKYPSLAGALAEVHIGGPLNGPTDVYGFEPWMEDISNNLERFTLFEKLFYDEMERLEKELRQSPMDDFVEATTSLVNERNG